MNHFWKFITLIGLVYVTSNCSNRTVRPEFSVVQLDTLFTCGTVSYSVQYSYTTIANAAASPALQAIEEANSRYFFGLEETPANPRKGMEAALTALCSEAQTPDGSSFGWESTEAIESEATVVDSVLVYTIASSSYQGGAHGIYGIDAHNYSLKGGYELTLNDLFGPRERQALDSLIRAQLYDRYEVADDEGLAAEGFFPEYIAAPENFALTQEGITFYFNPYDIGCYALGGLEVSLTHQDLEHM